MSARGGHFGGGPVHPTLNANTFAMRGWQWSPDWAAWLDTDGEQGAEPPEDVKRLRVLRDQILGEPDEDARNASDARSFRDSHGQHLVDRPGRG